MTYTWEQAEADSKIAEQMEQQLHGAGWQYVLFQAQRGAGLIELKEQTPYREFQKRVSEIGVQQRTSSNLMTLARHLPMLEQRRPDSQANALKLIKAEQPAKKSTPKPTPTPAPKQEREPEQEEEMKPFDTGMILVLTGISKSTCGSSLNTARGELIARFGEEALDTEDKYWVAAKQFAAEKKCAARFKEADKIREEIEKLSKSAQLQINKAVSAKAAMLEADFDRRVREAADTMIPDRVRIYEELQAKADAAQLRYYALSSGIGAHIDQQEYRILRSFFHSDKTPTDQQKNEAFHIIQKIGEYVKATAQ